MLITCPSCQFTQNVPDDKVPPRSKVATCPQCNVRFQFRELQEESAPSPAPPAWHPESPQVQAPLLPDTNPDASAEDESTVEQPPYYGPDGRGVDKPTLEQPDPAPQYDDEPVYDDQQADAEDDHEGMSAAERYLASKQAKSADATTTGTSQGPKPSGPMQVEVPFEDLENYGFFTGMAQTIKRACFSPQLFFSVMPLRGLIRPLVFAVLLVEFMFVMGAFWQLSGMPNLNSFLMDHQGIAPPSVEETLNPVLMFIIVPLLSIMNLFLNTLVVHGVLSLAGGAKRGVEGTLRVMAYSQAPLILAAIPFGVTIAVFWSLGISIIGIKHMHSTDWGRTILAHVVLLVALAVIFFGPMLTAMPPMPPAG